jgi:predicted metal-dependent hydrolase
VYKRAFLVSWLNWLTPHKKSAKTKAAIQESQLLVADVSVRVIRKPIKHLHLRLVPPTGVVQVSAPMHLSDERIRLTVLERLDWIKAKQVAFTLRPKPSVRQYMTGEVHDYLGQTYRLYVVECKGKQQVVLTEHGLQMTVSAHTTLEKRAALMDAFYRATLKDMMPSLLAKWQPIMGVQANDWGIKVMKTRWGTCNTRDKRIWMSLMLAKAPVECVEYVLVHELTHLLERNHTPRFHALMTQFLPNWPDLKQQLNQSSRSEQRL